MCDRARSPPACGRAACPSGRRTAGPRCPRRGPAPRPRTSPAPADCRRRTRAGWRWLRRAQPSKRSRIARSSSRLAALLAASRAAMTAASGDGGGAAPAAGRRLGTAADERMLRRAPGSTLGRRSLRRRSRRGDGRRIVGKPVDRRLADQRVDARLLVEGEKLAGSLVAVAVHSQVCGKAMAQRLQPCLRRARIESAAGASCGFRSPRPRPSGGRMAAADWAMHHPVGMWFAKKGDIFELE